MDKILNIPIDTVPGKASFESKSVEMARILFIAIVTEGCQEEVAYLHGLQDKYREELADVNLVILNDYYLSEINAVGGSHPKKRYEAMKEWRADYSAKMGVSAQDEEFLICDRDNGSFKDEQYMELVEEDKNHPNFHFIVSNPAFQLWLLFHFTNDIEELKLADIPKCKHRIEAVEAKLKALMVPYSYKHGELNWQHFSTRVGVAINNSKAYQLSILELKDQFGTNFPSFLEYIENWIRKPIFEKI